MAVSREEMLLQLELAKARARRRREELTDVDWSTVLEGAGVGAGAGAATLPAVATLARSRDVGVRPPRTPPTGFRTTTGAGRSRGVRSALVAAMDEIAESAARNPRAFAAAEVAGGAGAGAAAGLAREAAENKELGPAGTAVAEMGAGLVGGVAASQAPVTAWNTLRSLGRWAGNDLVQLITASPLLGTLAKRTPGLGQYAERVVAGTAERRAAQELQRLSADPRLAAQRALDAPEGVSPARAAEEPGLMAQQALIMKEDPAFGRMITDSLETAVNRTQGELKDLYATPRGRQDWERAVVAHGAVPGAEIPPGSPSEMLDSAYRSYGPAYAPFRQFPAKPRLLEMTRSTPLNVMFRNLVNSRATMAGEETRRSVGRWLEGKLGALSRRQNKEGFVTTGDLLDLRSDIRAKIREAPDTSDGSDRAELLELAESRVNSVLKSWLPPDSMKLLSSVDRQYGVLKTITAAVRRDKDRQLTPNNLLAELRYSSTRGAAGALRREAQSGREAAELLKKPDRARVIAGQLDDAGRANMRNDLVHTLQTRASRDGVVDGVQLGRLLRENTPVARELGMTHEEIGKLERVAGALRMMQRPSPEAADRLLHDGPSDVMQLLASLTAAKTASAAVKATGSGAGGLTFAGFMGRYYRRLLNEMTSDRAATLLIEASRPENKALYAALLTKNTDPPIKHKQAARLLNAWLYAQVLPDAADALGGAADVGLEELRGAAAELGE